MIEAAYLVHHLRAGLLRRMADGEEDRGLGQRMDGHVQECREVGDRAAHAERERDDAHVLDRRIREQSLDVLLPRQQQRGDDDGEQAEAHHQLAGERRLQRALDQHLAADDGVERDVEQQPGQHRGHRRRPLGVRVGQPVVQRHETDLGPVSDQQEHEGDRQHRRLELALDVVELGPQQRAAAGAQQLLGREVEQDRAEQRLGDADAAENEVLPRRLEARRRAVERHQQHGRERRRLHRDPEDPHVVRQQRHQHRAIEELVHAVVEPEPARGEAPVLLLDPHVGARKDRRGEPDERSERDQEDVEGVDEELPVEDEQRPVEDHARSQRDGGDEREEADGDVDGRRLSALADEREQRGAGERQAEDGEYLDHSLALFQLLEVLEVEAVELLADLEEEHAERSACRPARRARCRVRRPSACRRSRWSPRRRGRSPSPGIRSPAAAPCAA